jgi:hypothetical protein
LAAAVAVVAISRSFHQPQFNQVSCFTRSAEFKKAEAAASEVEEETAGELRTQLSGSAAAPTANARRTKDALIHQEGHNQVLAMGPVYKPAQQTDRRLEYQVNLNYQINDLKGARAFFNQWIPRFGFLQNESASGQGDGHMTLSVRVRSANLYTALSELDAIGTLAHEQINVVDHTENAVYQQMLAAREQIRLRRRSVAAGQNACGLAQLAGGRNSARSKRRQRTANPHRRMAHQRQSAVGNHHRAADNACSNKTGSDRGASLSECICRISQPAVAHALCSNLRCTHSWFNLAGLARCSEVYFSEGL